MKLRILAVGSKMPAWVEEGCREYSKRMPRELRIDIQEFPLAQRGKSASADKAKTQESEALLKAIGEKEMVIALDVRGKSLSTEQLAEQLQGWQMNGRDICLLIGGPDGMTSACLQRADLRWSLSDLTLPHPLVRIVLMEQLYRAWTINNNHPYHRA